MKDSPARGDGLSTQEIIGWDGRGGGGGEGEDVCVCVGKGKLGKGLGGVKM